MMLPLIDADMIVYQAGFASERKHLRVTTKSGKSLLLQKGITRTMIEKKFPNIRIDEEILEVDPPHFAFHRAKLQLNAIIKRFTDRKKCHICFLTKSNDETQFRNKIAVTQGYKANRKDVKRPEHYQEIRDYIKRTFVTKVISYYEADDALAMWHTANPLSTIVCSQDKDALTYPGKHYSWERRYNGKTVKEEQYLEISEDIANYNLFKQLLIGDTADNIPGLKKGFGPAAADKCLGGVGASKKRLFELVWNAYSLHGLSEDRFYEIANLLFIVRKKDQTFKDWMNE